ncbi:MAG: SprT-like domain-containing protein [Erysipelotrichaceae bacterium]|nr:SprT-like domain-containing protein [Erysipelotrichaceae bacterium]
MDILMEFHDEALKREILEAVSVLERMGIKPGTIRKVTISTRMSRTLGKTIVKDWKKGEFEIRFSSILLDPDCPETIRLSTIYHELLHTSDGCFDHGRLWKRYASAVSKLTGLEISRVADGNQIPAHVRQKTPQRQPKYLIVCPRCGFQQTRKQMSPVLKNLKNYRCPRCHGNLKLMRIKTG